MNYNRTMGFGCLVMSVVWDGRLEHKFSLYAMFWTVGFVIGTVMLLGSDAAWRPRS